MNDLKKYEAQMDKCSHCEFCQAACPVFLEDLIETHVARARMELIRASLLDKSMPVTKRIREVIGRCLACGNCSRTCPAAMPVDEIVMAARNMIAEKNIIDIPKQFFMRMFMNGRGFDSILAAAQTVARKQGIAPREIPAPAPVRFDRIKMESVPILADGKKRASAIYFVGCATNYFYPDTAMDVVHVLARNGVEVSIPENIVCCGLPAMVEGDFDAVRKMARRNLAILDSEKADVILTDCTSCGMMLKNKLVKILEDDDPLLRSAVSISAKVFEVTDYLNQIGLAAAPSPLPVEYTYHVPCHRGWSKTLDDAPQKLLAQIPGAKLIELDNPEKCCGAGGAFFLNYKKLSENIRSKKIEEILQTGADTIITQCPSCRSYLSPELPNKKVLHPISLLAKAYGLR